MMMKRFIPKVIKTNQFQKKFISLCINQPKSIFLSKQKFCYAKWVNPENQVPGKEVKGEYLEKYSVNLTKLAKEGKLDPVIGRSGLK